jgi:PAS domain S-box-containing protein
MTIHDVAGAPAEREGGVTQADPRRAPSELEALRREIERWHVLAGGDRGLLEALLHHSPHGIIVCDSAGKFVLQNRAAERIWAGSATIHGVQGWGQYRAFHPDGRPYEAEDWSMARCLSRREIVEAEEVHFQRFDGTHGILLGSCAPIFNAKGELEGALSVFADITPLKEAEERMERARAQWAARTERLLRITAGLADAVTPEQVTAAVVDHTAAVLGASSCALWLVSDDGRTASLARAVGYLDGQVSTFRRLPLDRRGELPVLDALATGEPLWFESLAALAERYPLAAEGARADVTHTVACLPMTVEGRTIGALAFTYVEASSPAEEDRSLLQVVTQHCAQALERIRVLRQAQLAYAETELLYRLTDAVNRAQSMGEVFDASLDTIKSALGVERAAILFFDADKVMRFEAWRGLSEDYCSAVEGHTPWGPEHPDPQSIFVEDAARDGHLAEFSELFRAEGIGALAFVPLVYEGKLLGKFMLYWSGPRTFSEREKNVARSIGDQVASAVGRKRAQHEREKLIDQLSQTVRLNELFVGVVGHDLRNPLMAIMSTAQLALRRDEGGRLFRPLSRILSASERMTRMIEQLLDFTRARVGGGILLEPSEMDLGALGRHVLAEIEDAHAERSILVETIGNLEGVWDPDRLAQVISNLAGNAVSHGTSAAPVRVVLDGSRGDAVSIRISNDGTIRPEILPVLFEPFRGTSVRRDQARGLGLGLYITQQIVLAHGGTVNVTSSEREGTTFTVELPRRAPARTPATGIAATARQPA